NNEPSYDVWKTAPAGGAPMRITFYGGEDPLESPDGEWVYYTKPGDSLWRCPAGGGPEEWLVNGVGGGRYAIVGDRVYYIQNTGARGFSLNVLLLSTRKTGQIATLQGEIGIGLTVSPDDREILFTKRQPAADLMLVEGFR